MERAWASGVFLSPGSLGVKSLGLWNSLDFRVRQMERLPLAPPFADGHCRYGRAPAHLHLMRHFI